MHTRRSARVRAANALRTTTSADEEQDENNPQQTRKKRTTRKPAAQGKENVRLRKHALSTKTPLQDVTNNARITRSRRPRNAVEKPSKPDADASHIDNDDGITPISDKQSARRKNQRVDKSTASEGSPSAKDPGAETEVGEFDTSSAQDIEPDIAAAFSRSRHNDTAPIFPSKEKRVTRGDTDLQVEPPLSNPSTDEIQPNLSKPDSNAEDHEPEPSIDEIQPNSPAKKRRTPSLLSDSSDEIRPTHATNARASNDSLRMARVRSPSPAISDSPPPSPLVSHLVSEAPQSSWRNENHNENSADLDTVRPRQAVYTYGKRRRIARVSLPSMQALGVRAKSPSSESQSGSEKEDDENLSDAYAESEDESDESPKRNPKLQAFVTEQKKLWQEVDDMDLVVESD